MTPHLKETIRQRLEDLREKQNGLDTSVTIKLFNSIPNHDRPGIPSKYDISPTEGLQLDEQYALLHFYGKTAAEAVAMYAENEFFYQEDILFMGWNAFAYYIDTPHALLLQEKEAARGTAIEEGDWHPASETASTLLMLISHHLEFAPAGLLDQPAAAISKLLLHLADIVADCAEIVQLDPPGYNYGRKYLRDPAIRGLVSYAETVRADPHTAITPGEIMRLHRLS
ncbi:hypothetical protein ICN84_10520 [Akkermansia glycaniphila]|uniref:hypothetical protein n=1 Tax=Akkermansia glycaniphila TaxID=1679444 RepID=UPI001C034E7F|nr:hypothetical protein [Akkermansia glycaniphila]MBT9450500.1 hypothetical protein [Akkermansia glycaniphila]